MSENCEHCHEIASARDALAAATRQVWQLTCDLDRAKDAESDARRRLRRAATFFTAVPEP